MSLMTFSGRVWMGGSRPTYGHFACTIGSVAVRVAKLASSSWKMSGCVDQLILPAERTIF